MKSRFLPSLVTTAVLLAAALLCPAGARESALTTGPAWRFTGPVKLKGKKDISAFDSLDGKTGVVATDEGNTVQIVRIDAKNGVLSVVGNVDLLGGGKVEADIEAIAAAPEEKCYYVTGSHAVSRKKGEIEATRSHIFKLETDASGAPTGKVKKASLRPVIASVPELKPFLDKPAEENGVDVEGLAWREGRLYVGLRAPVERGKAWILEVDPACVFGGKPPAAKAHAVELPEGTGIRAMATIKEGLVFLNGDSGRGQTTTAPGLYFWDPAGGEVIRLGDVPEYGAKPEALYVIRDTDAEMEVLVIRDGVADGAPQTMKIKKRPGTDG